jgi:hypothetical protein
LVGNNNKKETTTMSPTTTPTPITNYPKPEDADRHLRFQAKLAARLARLRLMSETPLPVLQDRTAVPYPLIQAYEQGLLPIPLHTYWILCHGFDTLPTDLFMPVEPIDVMDFIPESCHAFY